MGTEENTMLAASASGFSALILFVLSPNSHFLFFFLLLLMWYSSNKKVLHWGFFQFFGASFFFFFFDFFFCAVPCFHCSFLFFFSFRQLVVSLRAQLWWIFILGHVVCSIPKRIRAFFLLRNRRYGFTFSAIFH